MLHKMLKNLWAIIPERIQRSIVKSLNRLGIRNNTVRILEKKIGYSEVKRYAFYLVQHFDEEVEKIRKDPKFVKVNLGYHVGFHAGIVTNVLEYSVSAMQKGMIPVFFVDNHIETDDHVCLEWFFEQPCTSIFDMHIHYNDGQIYYQGEINNPYSIKWDYLWNKDEAEWIVWKELAKKLIVKNDYFINYVKNDKVRNCIDTSKMLGVIMRGTDYTKLKPKSHPVQPGVEEVLNKIREVMKGQEYDSIYVATDEKRIFDKVILEFGEDKVFSNSRIYYDEIYRNNNLYQINDAKGNRDNDEFLRSVEYMSSMVILSECKGILGGTCSGTVFAALLAENSFYYFFNKGMY